MIYLSYEIAAEINRQMIQKYSKGEKVGVKEPALLDSAVNRPLQTMFGEALYKDVFDKATALFESISKNHAFYNANKRTGFACMTYFLFINGHVCVMNEKKAADLTVDFVVGKLTFEEVAKIIKEHSYRKSSQS